MGAHSHTQIHNYTRTQPQLFCYFPLQHLVLISFLMRLRLRPIREDYQRRSGVGCMPTMTPVPRDRPGWKRPQYYTHKHTHTSMQYSLKQKHEPYVGSYKIVWLCHIIHKEADLHYTAACIYSTYMVNHSVLTSCWWITEEIQNGVLPLCPSRGTKTTPLMQSLMETLQNIERDYDSELGYKNTHYVFRMNTEMTEIILVMPTLAFSCSYLMTNQWKLYWSYVRLRDLDVWSRGLRQRKVYLYNY